MSNIHLQTIASSEKFVNFFEVIGAIPDPRMDRCKKHSLANIIAIAIFAILGQSNTAVAINKFGIRHKEELELMLDMPFGIPSRSTFSRALNFIDPLELDFWLQYWEESLCESVDCKHIAIDGKEDNACGFNCLRAFDVANCRVLAHEKIAEKSNEITAAPPLLEKLNLVRVAVTADAMHTQRKTAKKIIDKDGDYLLVLKGNQHQLHADVKLFFDDIERNGDLEGICSRCEIFEKSRNRFEKRICISTGYIKWIYARNQWKGLRSISVIISSRTIGKRTITERRYFISSLESDAKKISALARAHWAIENQCHRSLDEEFGSDRSTIRNWRAALNLSILKDFALFILKKIDSGESLREKRITNNCQFDHLIKMLYL